jgi:hypothetical protein
VAGRTGAVTSATAAPSLAAACSLAATGAATDFFARDLFAGAVGASALVVADSAASLAAAAAAAFLEDARREPRGALTGVTEASGVVFSLSFTISGALLARPSDLVTSPVFRVRRPDCGCATNSVDAAGTKLWQLAAVSHSVAFGTRYPSRFSCTDAGRNAAR